MCVWQQTARIDVPIIATTLNVLHHALQCLLKTQYKPKMEPVLQTKLVSIDSTAKQWRGHCSSIAAKLDAAAAASAASGPSQHHVGSRQPAYEDAEEQTQQLSQSVGKAELQGLAEQVSPTRQ